MDIQSIRKKFPIFNNQKDLTYLDSASSSLKLGSVVEKLTEYYEQYPVNVKRGVYKLAQRADEEYENSREKIAEFINAKNSDEVVFTRGTTESINLIAYALGREIVGRNDEIVTTVMEHHSNFIPWQILAQETGGTLKVIDIEDDGVLATGKDNNLHTIVTKRTKILALTYVSNVLGVINPIKDIVKAARKINPFIVVVVDGAQAPAHLWIDVQDLDCDFFAFSGHKMYGPTGVGVLWGKKSHLDAMFPFQYGGEMIEEVTLEKTTFAKPPHKFEAGTPPIADAIALRQAVEFLTEIGLEKIFEHEKEILSYLIENLNKEFGESLTIYGPTDLKKRAGVVSFSIKGIHAHDIGSILDEQGICVRAGHHCTMPLHKRLGTAASTRVSVGVYTTKGDIDILVSALHKARKLLIKA